VVGKVLLISNDLAALLLLLHCASAFTNTYKIQIHTKFLKCRCTESARSTDKRLCQWSNACLKSSVLSLHLKTIVSVMKCRREGRLFQTTGPA